MATQPTVPAPTRLDPAVHVPLAAPDGSVHYVPAEQAGNAVAAGGRAVLKAPDGTIRSVAVADVPRALAAGGQPVVAMYAPDDTLRWVAQSDVHAALAAGGKLDVPNTPNAVVAPYHPGLFARLRETVANSAVGHSLQQALPRVASALDLEPSETVNSPTYRSDASQLLAPQYAVPANAHGAVANVARGALTGAGVLTSGQSIAMLALPGAEALGLGEVGTRAFARLLSAGFAGSQIVGIAQHAPQLVRLLNDGKAGQAEQMLGELGVEAGTAGLAAAHASGAFERGPVLPDNEPGEGTEAAPERAEPAAAHPDIQTAVQQGGAQFAGVRQVPGKAGFVLFTDPQTQSTLALPADQVTTDAVRARLTESRAAHSAAGNTAPGAAGTAPATTALQSTPAPVGDVGATEPNLQLNINLDNLHTSDDVRSAIASLAANHAEAFSDQRRGVVPLGTTKDVAQRMVRDGLITPEHVASVASGTAWNAEQLTAARSIMLSVGNAAKRAAEAYQAEDSDENLVAVTTAIQKFGAVQKSVAGLTAEAGRALRSFGIAARAVRSKSQFEAALNALGGRDLNAQAAADLAAIPEGDTESTAKFLRSQDRWTFPQKAQAWWTASLLSSPRTLAAKLTGDAVMAALDTPIRLVRGGVDALLSAINADRPRKYYAAEAVSALHGLVHGLGEGFGKALYVMRTGLEPPKLSTANELEVPPHELFENARTAVGRATGRVVNFGPRFLRAATAAMETAGQQSELEAGALRLALQKGLRGEDARADAANILANPPDELVQHAAEFARRQTFTNGSKFLRAIQRVVDTPTIAGAHPVRFIVPFLRVPYNIAARGIELTPLGVIAGAAKADPDLIARGLVGSMVLAYGAHLAANGYLTGDIPQTQADREAFYAEGKQPFSVRIGNEWVSYERNFGIAGMPLAAAAAFRARFEHQGLSAAPSASEQAILGIAHLFGSLPMVEGINALTQAISNPQRFGGELASALAEGFIPVSAGLRDAARLQDPTIRDVRGVYQRVLSGLPFVQETLPLKRDVLGRVQTNRGAAGLANAVLPSPVSSARPLSPVDSELARLGVYPGPASADIVLGNKRIRLSPAAQQARQQLVGAAIQREASAIMRSDGYARLTDESRRDLLQRDLARVRRWADKQFADRLRANVRQPHAQ